MTFVNREKEIAFLNGFFETEPNSILIVYGPKSCGKTTLLLKVVEALDKKKYAVNYIDLRRVLIYNFKSFLNTFFPKNLKEQVKDIFSGVTLNTGFFSVGIDDEAMLEQNPFKVMEEKLAAANKRGIRPIIIIDEIQMLQQIYINGERYLLDEIFNFFVAITKVTHSAHVVIASSDSFFIEKIHKNSKLLKTSQLLLVNHLEEDVVKEWLDTEGFSKAEINTVWKNFGGSSWEIAETIRQKKAGANIEKYCETIIQQYVGMLHHTIVLKDHSQEKMNLYYEITNLIVSNKKAVISDFSVKDYEVKELAEVMIERDLWFFETLKGEITANSQSIYWAMKKLVEQYKIRN